MRAGNVGTLNWQEQSASGDRVKATFVLPGATVSSFGFTPVLMTVENREARDLKFQITFQGTTSTSGGQKRASTAVQVPVPNQPTSERWLFVPSAEAGRFTVNRNGYGGNLGIQVSGTGGPTQYLNLGSGNSRRNGTMAPWAASDSLFTEVRRRVSLISAPMPAGRPGYIRTPTGFAVGQMPVVQGEPNIASFDLTQTFGDWRIWSPFMRVIVGAEEFRTMPPVNREALRNWVALGGYLYLSPTTPGVAGDELYGAGRIITLAHPIESGSTDIAGLLTQTGVFAPTLAIPSPLDLALARGTVADLVPNSKSTGDWLMYFFLGFAVIMGPINLYLIAPVRRRHRLFFSVPLISLATVAILGAAIVTQDGFGGAGARRALVVLLPGSNQAAVFQDQITRTGVLFETTFPIADDTVCAAMQTADINYRPDEPPLFTRQEGTGSGDWFRARTRQAQHLRRLTPTRARVERVGQAPDGAPIVQSSVSVGLRDFRYVDSNGVLWSAPAVAPGTRVTLQRAAAAATYDDYVNAFSAGGSPHFGQLVNATVKHTAPERFLALIDDGELAPLPTLAGIRWLDSKVLITGLVAAPGKGGTQP